MSETDRTTINLQEVKTRADIAQHIITGFSRAMPNLAEWWQEIRDSLSDIPILALEIGRLGNQLTLVRINLANLAAVGRATLAAHHDGEDDPLYYLRDELDAQGFGSTWRPE